MSGAFYVGSYDVECPKCGVERGLSCRTTSGTNRVTDIHAARAERYYAERQQRETDWAAYGERS